MNDRLPSNPRRPLSGAVEPRSRAASGATRLALLGVSILALAPIARAAPAGCPPLLDRAFVRLQGDRPQSLCEHAGRVLLVVNTASLCGYTPQYEGLEALHRKYRDRGLVVAGFPSNDFGGQEPGTNREIAQFCRTFYGIGFPMYERSSVTGPAANPLFRDLAARSGEPPRWNFHKYLVDRRGETVRSFASDVEPDDRRLVRAIESLLAEPPTAGGHAPAPAPPHQVPATPKRSPP